MVESCTHIGLHGLDYSCIPKLSHERLVLTLSNYLLILHQADTASLIDVEEEP